MTPEQAYEELEPRLKAIPADEVHPPTRGSVNEMIDEFERVSKVTDRDRAGFVPLAEAAVFDIMNVDLLHAASLCLHYAEGRWIVCSNPQKDPATDEKLKRAEEVRSILLMDLDFVARKFNPSGLVATLSEVREGSSKRDMLQDITTLNALSDKYAEYLSKIGHDKALDTEASTLCSELSGVLNMSNEETARAKEMRDRALTLAQNMYDEVRAAGQFLFRKNPQKLSDYVNQIRK